MEDALDGLITGTFKEIRKEILEKPGITEAALEQKILRNGS